MPVIIERKIPVSPGKHIAIKEKDPKYSDPYSPLYVRLSISDRALNKTQRPKRSGG